MNTGRRRGALEMAGAVASAAVVVSLATLLICVTMDGWGVLDATFLTGSPSRFPERAGVGPAIAGTLWLAALTAVVAFPIGVGTAVYLEEYAPRRRWVGVVESMIANLAGVPSIIYGILGLALFVRGLGLGSSILAGGLTLASLALPTVILASQEAIRAVPDGLRHAAFGLGATRWQVVRRQVLPAAAPGIVTGATLAFTRAVGETAPLLVIGATSFIAFAPKSLGDPFTSLPTQIYAWVARPQDEFTALAAGAIIALFSFLIALNLSALAIRRRLRRQNR